MEVGLGGFQRGRAGVRGGLKSFGVGGGEEGSGTRGPLIWWRGGCVFILFTDPPPS